MTTTSVTNNNELNEVQAAHAAKEKSTMHCPKCSNPAMCVENDTYRCTVCNGTFNFSAPPDCPMCGDPVEQTDLRWKCSCRARGDIDDDGKPMPPGGMLALEVAIQRGGPGAGYLPLHDLPVPIYLKRGQKLVASIDLQTFFKAARKKAEELKPPPEPEPEQIPQDVIGVSSVYRRIELKRGHLNPHEFNKMLSQLDVQIYRKGSNNEQMKLSDGHAVERAFAGAEQ